MANNPQSFESDPQIQFYRQPGGCVEIWEGYDFNDENVIHIHQHDIPAFLTALTEFVKNTDAQS